LFGAALLFLINITGFRNSNLFDFSYFKVLVTAIQFKNISLLKKYFSLRTKVNG